MRKNRLLYYGESRDNGFTIYCGGREYFKIGNPENENKEKELMRVRKMIINAALLGFLLTIAIIIPSFVLMANALTPFSIFLVFIAFIISSAAALLTMAFISFLTYECKQWHSLEHKMIRLLEKNAPITLKNIKKTKPYSIFCGSVFMSFFHAALLALSAMLFSTFYLSDETTAKIGLYSLLASLIILPIAVQKYGVYKKPTEKQYEEVLKKWEEMNLQTKKSR